MRKSSVGNMYPVKALTAEASHARRTAVATAAMYSWSALGTRLMMRTVRSRPAFSDLDLLSEFDDPVHRNLEIRGWLFGEFAGDGEHMFSPESHPHSSAWYNDFTAQKKGGV